LLEDDLDAEDDDEDEEEEGEDKSPPRPTLKETGISFYSFNQA